ncbi:MAG: DUF6438 domain-containing protein [Pyrinomonadaceae bacterium]
MRKFIFLFLAVACFVSVENTAAHAQSPTAAEITEISLSYSGSHFAAASGFTIVLRKDGTTTYSGAKGSSREGDYVGTFDKREFTKLAKFIVAQDFFSLKDNYLENVQDGGTTRTRVVFAGGEKTIKNNSWRKSNVGDNRLPDSEAAVGAIDQKLLIRWKKVKK